MAFSGHNVNPSETHSLLLLLFLVVRCQEAAAAAAAPTQLNQQTANVTSECM